MVNILSILPNSTEAKTKNATNIEPLGPYNKQLLDLSVLSFNAKSLSVIVSVLSKRLCAYTKDHRSQHDDTPAKPSISRHLKRSKSLPHHSMKNTAASSINRSNTTHLAGGSSSQDKQCLTVLKCLTVIMYLLQYGSDQFVDWIKVNHASIITPLKHVGFTAQYRHSIESKLDSLQHYVNDATALRQLRISMHKLRSDFGTPGVKIDLQQQVSHEPSGSNYHHSPPRRRSWDGEDHQPRLINSRSLDLPRQSVHSPDANHHLSTLVEEASSDNLPSSYPSPIVDYRRVPNNPFQANSNPFSY